MANPHTHTHTHTRGINPRPVFCAYTARLLSNA